MPPAPSKPIALRIVLATLLAGVIVAAFVSASDGDAPHGAPPDANAAPAPPPPLPVPATVALPGREIVGVEHVLVTWRGAERAPARVTRTKEEARARAEQALARLRAGASFAEVVRDFSDDETTKPAGGAMGNIERGVMPQPFTDVAFSLEVGATSGIVETPLGFHVIRRSR